MKIEIEVPEGMEYDYVIYNPDNTIATVNFRKKKPETRWFRAYTYKTSRGNNIDHYSAVKEDGRIAIELACENSDNFIKWITPWTEYEI